MSQGGMALANPQLTILNSWLGAERAPLDQYQSNRKTSIPCSDASLISLEAQLGSLSSKQPHDGVRG